MHIYTYCFYQKYYLSLQKKQSDMKPSRNFNSAEDAMEFCKGLPINAILEMCVELIMERQQFKKINITEEQFKAMFKITGIREDGTVENRGRSRTK